MFRRIASSLLILAIVAPALADDKTPKTRPTDQQRKIALEIARLGNSNNTECTAAVRALVKIGKPAAPALVKALSDPRNDVRAFAAKALRPILAADPTSAPNYHNKAYWKQRVDKLKPGMTVDEALKVLLPELSPAARRETFEGGDGSGRSATETYRLDDYWTVILYLIDDGKEGLHDDPVYLLDFGQDGLHDYAPHLVRSVQQAWVAPPANYTGKWVTWHVNGQEDNEIQYRNGQYDGTFTAFHDDGSKAYEQHYTKGICHGTDTGWHRNGRKAYEGRYEHGKQVGTWRWWKEDGQVESVQEYEAGKLIEKTGN